MEAGPEPTSKSSEAADSGPGARSPFDAHSEIVALGGGGASKQHFWRTALQTIGRDLDSPYATLYVRYAAEVIDEDFHSGPTDPEFWKPSLQQFLTESLAEPKLHTRFLKARTGSVRIAFLAAPVFDSSCSSVGAVALVVPAAESFDVSASLARLEGLVRLASACFEGIGAAGARADGGAAASAVSASRSLSQAASYRTPEQMAFALTNELANRLGFQQVALGLVAGARVRVLSISGLDQVSPQSPGVVILRAAMEECLDRNSSIVHQVGQDWSGGRYSSGHRLHQQWHAASNGDAVASIPLTVGEGDRPVAILSLRSRADQPFTDQKIEELGDRVELLMPGLQLTCRASRGLCRHVLDNGRSIGRAVLAPGKWGRRVAVGLAVLLAGWFCFGTVQYDLRVPCVVTPAQLRHITAPFDAVIASASVVEMERVRKDQVLCTLDHRDLDLTRAEMVAELTVVERQMDQAMAGDSPVQVRLAQARARLVRARLATIDRRIEQATIRAPIDGIVVAGDLRRMIGNVVAQGTPLYQVAPFDGWTLELAVPESASTDLAIGQDGTFASVARPEDACEFHIVHVSASAEIRGGRNVYVAEAGLHNTADWVRPGMEGTARVHVGRRAVWWIVLHRAIDYLRVTLWL